MNDVKSAQVFYMSSYAVYDASSQHSVEGFRELSTNYRRLDVIMERMQRFGRPKGVEAAERERAISDYIVESSRL